MVDAAKGAGGLEIRGSLDTSLIERGFRRVKQGFASVKGFAKGFTSDLVRMRQAAGNLSKGLFKMAAAGASALIGFASKAPAVAGSMAKMSVAFDKIIRTLGVGLAPAFAKVAGWLDKFAVWAGAHPDIFAGIVISLSAIAALKLVGATGLLTALGSLVVSPTVLTALGYIATIGAVGFAGYKAATFVIDKLREYTGIGTDEDAPTDASGQTLFRRLPQKFISDITGVPAPWEDPLNPFSPAHDKAIAEIKAAGFQPTPGGMISAWKEEDRRFFLLAWWDAIWG